MKKVKKKKLVICLIILLVFIVGVVGVGVYITNANQPKTTGEAVSMSSSADSFVPLNTGLNYPSNYLSEDVQYSNLEGFSNIRNLQKMPELSKSEINELAKMRNELRTEKTKLAKAEQNYKSASVFTKSFKESTLKSQKAKVESKETILKNKLEEKKIPLELDAELDEIEEKATTWTPNYNTILMKDEEYKKKISSGVKIPEGGIKPQKASSQTGQKSAKSEAELPANFDWRNVGGKNYITDVRDQSDCGSCWAFATTAVLEGQANAYYNNPNLDLDLSEQDLVSCYLVAQLGKPGCKGATTEQVEYLFSNYLKDTGQCYENCFPYNDYLSNPDSPACEGKCSEWQTNVWKLKNYAEVIPTEASSVDLNANIDAIKRALVNYGPVEVGMVVYGDFSAYSGGIYRHTTEEIAGYHAVTIVGYGETDGLTYWIVKNSWGSGFGENGYFRIYADDSYISEWFAFAVKRSLTEKFHICTDRDRDGYCYWGLGGKPKSCPASCSTNSIEDCDDSNTRVYQGCGARTEELGELQITTTPADAEIYIQDLETGNYNFRGKTPLTTNLAISNRRIKIVKEDYETQEKTILIKKGETKKLNVQLNFLPKITLPLNDDIYRAGDMLEIKGIIPTRTYSDVKGYFIQWGAGEAPSVWKSDGIVLPIFSNTLFDIESDIGKWDTSAIKEAGFYTIKLTVSYADQSGKKYVKVTKTLIYLDPMIKEGWPKRIFVPRIEMFNSVLGFLDQPTIADIDKDGNKDILLSYSNDGLTSPNFLAYNYKGEIISALNIPHFGSQYGALYGDFNKDLNPDILFIAMDSEQGNRKLVLFNPSNNKYDSFDVLSSGFGTMISYDSNLDKFNEFAFIDWDDYLFFYKDLFPTQNFWSVPLFELDDCISYGIGFGGRNVCEGISSSKYPFYLNLDNDSDLEILATSYSRKTNKTTFYAFNLDGSRVDGFPKKIDFPSFCFTQGKFNKNIELACITRQDEKNIILFLINHDFKFTASNIINLESLFNADNIALFGTNFGNFDGKDYFVMMGRADNQNFVIFISAETLIVEKVYFLPMLFHLQLYPVGNLDGKNYVLAGFTYDGSQYYVNSMGEQLIFSGYGDLIMSVVISDIDNDLLNEMIFVDTKRIYVKDLAGKSGKEWGEINYDSAHSNCYDCEKRHSADTNKNWVIEKSELDRVTSFYNAGQYHCNHYTIDSFAPGAGVHTCRHHDADTNKDWAIGPTELSRVMGFYNAGGYHTDSSTKDGFAPGK